MRTYADYVYDIIKSDFEFYDAVYEDHIVSVIGTAGLTELRSNGLLEPCGAIADRQLYALVNKEHGNTCIK